MYKCLSQTSFSQENYTLVAIRKKDIFLIKNWRNEQLDLLRQKKKLSDLDQIAYYNGIIVPSFEELFPKQILFSILSDGQCIGYGGLVHIDWESKNAELSYLAATSRSNQLHTLETDMKNFLSLIEIVAFNYLKFRKIYTTAYEIRSTLIRVIEAKGYQKEGLLKEHVLINGTLKDVFIHSLFHSNYFE